MQIQFLGTSAAVGWPAAYCECEACNEIRRRGGKNIRTRTSLRLGVAHQIDCGPDLLAQLVRTGLTMSGVEHILFTHSHADHISVSELISKHMARTTQPQTVGVHASAATADRISRMLADVRTDLPEKKREAVRAMFPLDVLQFREEAAVGDLRVVPLRGNHVVLGNDEVAANYLIRAPEGRKLFYAVDTGWPLDETWSAIRGQQIDVLIMDCTFGGMTDRPTHPDTHMDCNAFEEAVREMVRIGAVHEGSEIFATHIGPHQGLLHEELVERFARTELPITVAYDGLKTTL